MPGGRVTAGHNGDHDPHASPPPFSVPRVRPRYKMDVRLRVTVPRTGELIHARSADFSEGGLGFFAPQEVGLGELVEVEFTPPYTRQALKVSAVVRNRNGYRYGIEFRHLTEAVRQTIARACNALSLTT